MRRPPVALADSILRPGQKQLLEAFSRSALVDAFYLSGGTALAAFHLGLKAEFTRYPFPRCEGGRDVGGVRVDSLRDILANKLLALTERSEPKDFVDLYCGLRARGAPAIDALVDDAERKFGLRGVRHMPRARFIGAVPPLGGLEMKTAVDPAEVQRFFNETARRRVRESLDEGD